MTHLVYVAAHVVEILLFFNVHLQNNETPTLQVFNRIISAFKGSQE